MNPKVIVDDQLLAKYRALLDEEENAFNMAEHFFEEGNRRGFEEQLERMAIASSKKGLLIEKLGGPKALVSLS
ncbi:MAG: hypothetical protein M0Z45_08145 [Actinomycetota bacterium]|nr:hypothetical protein [Actinomycetota bacterium]